MQKYARRSVCCTDERNEKKRKDAETLSASSRNQKMMKDKQNSSSCAFVRSFVHAFVIVPKNTWTLSHALPFCCVLCAARKCLLLLLILFGFSSPSSSPSSSWFYYCDFRVCADDDDDCSSARSTANEIVDSFPYGLPYLPYSLLLPPSSLFMTQ